MNCADRTFYERETLDVARDLLGATLVHDAADGSSSGRIVEVEAYRDASDLASHAARLKSGGVKSMSGPAGIAYVYRSYGIHAMFNIVAKTAGATGAVLIRALEPLTGIEVMRSRRGVSSERELGRGPGNLCQAMAIALVDHGTDLASCGRLRVIPGEAPKIVFAGRRIGISRSIEHPWRFFDGESQFVSSHRRGVPIEQIDPYSWITTSNLATADEEFPQDR